MTKWRTNEPSLQDQFMVKVHNESTSCIVLGYCLNSTDDVLRVVSDKSSVASSRKLKIFSEKGVYEIKVISHPTPWERCPENENPVDIRLRKCENQ